MTSDLPSQEGFCSMELVSLNLLFSSPPRPARFWGPPSLLVNGYQVLSPWG